MKHKYDFATFLKTFLAFVQTQLSCNVKVFQSDGGTKFLNNQVKNLIVENGTHYRISCPYTPDQNGHVERHRHITEIGLAMLFNAGAPCTDILMC